HGRAMDPDFGERFAHVVETEGLDYGGDHFHGFVLLQSWATGSILTSVAGAIGDDPVSHGLFVRWLIRDRIRSYSRVPRAVRYPARFAHPHRIHANRWRHRSP